MTEALLALVVDLSIAGVFFLIWYFYKESKTSKTEEKTKTAEAPTTPAPEKQFPWGLVIGGIVLIIAIIAIASVVSNLDSRPAPKKTASAEKIVTARVYANGIACAVTPFFEKGQTIVITAEGKIAGLTNNPTYEYVGPEGWRQNPNLQGYKIFLPSEPYMGLIGKLGKPELYGEWFYIGREKSIVTERSGTEEICFDYNRMNKKNNYKNNKGYCTVTIRVVD